ncbi:Exportin-1/Importin-beta-like [Trinorchestia longiramus]|nr:Exportin-1/Importin-beta-like [Trinorchestia longiramus]
MNPSVDNNARQEAYQTLEQAKDDIRVSIPCGFLLSNRSHPSIVRHFGLHLLEINIKYKWNQVSHEDKELIKNNTMTLVTTPGNSDAEERFIQDKVSRLVVELAKHMWPQLWPNFLADLQQCASCGPTHTQTVLLVLTRLSEDVAVLQTLECQKRRRELYQSLSSSMTDIFAWLLLLLNQHNITSSSQEAQQHVPLFQDVLQCLTSLVEWVAVHHVFSDAGRLLQLLCCLLRDEGLQLSAAQCLLSVVSRKGNMEDRLPLLSLFHNDCLGAIYDSACSVLQSSDADANYSFIKTLAQIVTQLAVQLCTLWGKVDSVSQPQNFEQYLFLLHSFGEHPSITVHSSFITAWSVILRHPVAATSPLVAACISKWLPTVPMKVLHAGQPSASDSPVCHYSRLDFDDSDEEFSEYFFKVRGEILQCFRTTAVMTPDAVWSLVAEQCNNLLALAKPKMLEGDQDLSHTAYYRQWEAASTLVEWIMKSKSHEEHDAGARTIGLRLLLRFVEYRTDDPKVLLLILSCISNLFPFIVHQAEILTPVFYKLMEPLVAYSRSNDPSKLRSKSLNELRRHCAFLVAKLAKLYPSIMLPGFTMVANIVKELNESANPPAMLQQIVLQEALLLINNARHNYEEQLAYVESVMQPVAVFLERSKDKLNSPLQFMDFIGISDSATDESSEKYKEASKNRFQLSYGLKLIEAVAKKSQPPSDRALQVAGGFIMEVKDGGFQVRELVRNPCWPPLLRLLHPLMAVVRASNSLWMPECLAALPKCLANVHQLPKHEKENVLVLKNVVFTEEIEQSTTERLQNFLHLLHDSWNCCLAEVCRCCHPDIFYSTENLLQYTLQAPLYCLQHLPDYRLRVLYRLLLRPWLMNCPAAVRPAFVLPILQHLIDFMTDHLKRRWQSVDCSVVQRGDMIAHQQDEDEDDQQQPGADVNPELEEMLDVIMLRLLNRDYIDFSRALTVKSWRSKEAESNDANSAHSTNGAGVPDASESSGPTSSGGAGPAGADEVSPIGELVLNSPVMAPFIAGLLLSMSCPDSICSLKACTLLGVCIKTAPLTGLSDEVCCGLLRAVLAGLQVHGEHLENRQALLTCSVLCYTCLRPHCLALPQVCCVPHCLALPQVCCVPHCCLVLLQVCCVPHCLVLPQVLAAISPGATGDIAAFDKIVLEASSSTTKNTKQERQKKEYLRKIVSPMIGTSVSEALKQKVCTPTLPPLFLWRAPKNNSNALEGSEADIGLANLFS